MLCKLLTATQLMPNFTGHRFGPHTGDVPPRHRHQGAPRAANPLIRHQGVAPRHTNATGNGYSRPQVVTAVTIASCVALADRVGRRLLSQAHVDGPGHCTFTTGETVAAVHALEDRLDTGHWDTSATALNSRAEQADPTTAGRYVTYRPTEYPRPYDVARGAARP